MAVIYSYPTKSNPVGGDLILISDSADNNKTKQVAISSLPSSGGGSVTSVGLSMPAAFAVANSPITGTGTIAVTTTGGSAGQYLAHDGTWGVPAGSYTLPLATNSALGGIKIGFTQTAKKYPVELLSEAAFVEVPWTDNNTTYSAGDGITLTSTSFSANIKSNSGIDIDGVQMALDLSASDITGILAVGDGGTGLSTVGAGLVPRGNSIGAMVADNYLQYEGASKSLKIRGTGNTAPSLACTLGINDAQGPTGKVACIGLTPTGAQGAKAMHIDLGAYNAGMQINRNNSLASLAIQFQQTVSGNTSIGSISMTNSATAYNTSSDYRLKENIVDMTGAVDRVKQLKPKRFNFTVDADTIVDGFLAHEAQAIVPESVTGTKDEVDADGNAVYQGIDQAKLVPLLVGAIKELTARIEALEA